MPALSDIRHELTAAFMRGPEGEMARARTTAALLGAFIPILLIELLLVSTFGVPIGGFLFGVAGLAVAFVIALRGHGRLSGWVALAALLSAPLVSVLADLPSSVIVGIYLVQSTFAALVIGLILMRPRPYLGFMLVLFTGMLAVGYFVELGTPDTQMVLPLAATVMLELISVILVIVILRSAEAYSRRLTEAELRRNEERYRLVSKLVGDVLYSVKAGSGPTYTVDWMSGRGTFDQFTNLPLDGMIDITLFIHPEDVQRFNEALAPVLHGEQASIEARILSPAGEARWVRALAYGVRDPVSGLVIDIYGVLEDIHDRKMAEDALRDERSRYEDLVNSIDGMVYEINAETRETLFISRQVERTLGFPVQAFLDDPMLWIECVHPEDVEAVVSFSKGKVARHEGYATQYRMVAADGQIVWVRDIATIIAEPGKPVRLRGLAINETASREAQRAEQEQRRLGEALRETTAAISATLDLDEVVERMFSALQLTTPADAADIMFIEHEKARVFRARDFAGNADMEQMLKVELPIAGTPNLRRMVETGRPLIVQDVATDAEWVTFFEAAWIGSTCGVPIRLDEQTIGFLNLTSTRPYAFTQEHAEFLQTFADQIAIAVRNARLYAQARQNAEALTEQVKERTAELELERGRLSVMLDSTADGIYYTEGYVIRYANPAFCAMVGYQADELIGQSTEILAPSAVQEARDHTRVVFEALARERVWRGERTIRRKDGTLLEGGLTISMISPADSPVARLVVLVRDISREKALQAQQSNLVAYASHELRTPITNLKTRLYLLRRRPELLDEHIQILEEVTDRMRRLVEDLLDLTRMERGVTRLQRRIVDVVALSRSIYRLQLPEADRKGLHFSATLPDAPIYADVDPERITQVITNLVTNALNYTPAGGSVLISVTPTRGKPGVLLQVTDTGVGIAADNLPFIFQPFYRVVSAVEGAGLGLSIAREIVEMHGGEITVQSQTGLGSTFTVRLPVVDAPVAVAGG